jgi:APA family basic amino acid/polyamine antiporter
VTASGPALLRQINLSGAVALVISNTVGVGILTSSGYLARDLGDPVLFLAIWLVGGIIAWIGALCYSELGMNFPASGGEYVYLTQAYGPVWGFMTGWTSFLAGFAAPVAAASLAFADYAGTFFPVFQQTNTYWQLGSGMFSLRLGGAQVLASAAIGSLTLANLFGVQRAANLQKVLTGLKISVLGLFVLLALLVGSGNWANFSLPSLRESTTPIAAQFAVSFYFVYVSFSGWNAATYIAEEIRDPQRNLPRALLIGTAIVTVLYLALNVVFLYAAPLGVLKGVVAVGALASSRLFGPQVAGIFSALMAVALLATVNAMITVGPRVAYAMARNRAFFPAAANVDPHWRTPVPAILMQATVSMLMTMTTLPSLFFFIGFTLNFFALMSVAALFRFRRRPGWRRMEAVSIAWPLLPVIFLTLGTWMTLFGLTLEPKISLTACAIIGAGALYYQRQLKQRKGETHWDASSTVS